MWGTGVGPEVAEPHAVGAVSLTAGSGLGLVVKKTRHVVECFEIPEVKEQLMELAHQ